MTWREEQERKLQAEYAASPMGPVQREVRESSYAERSESLRIGRELGFVEEEPQGILTTVEMSLRYRGPACTWVRAERNVLVGCEKGRTFAIALDAGMGITRPMQQTLERWKKAGARVGTASNIRQALAVVTGVRDEG